MKQPTLPKITPQMQMHRLNDLWHATHTEDSPEEFFKNRVGRTYSSLEEELVCGLPLWDEAEQAELMNKAQTIVQPLGLQFPDQRAFAAVKQKDPELGKNITALGLLNFQHLMQNEFYRVYLPLFEKHQNIEERVSYEKTTDMKFLGVNAKMLEHYTYGDAGSYRALFYTLLRHLSNIQGGEDARDLTQKAQTALVGKRVLELGSGPGYFLHFLREQGAKEVLGVEINSKVHPYAEKINVPLVQEDAKNLTNVLTGEKFDLIISRDFLSVPVTKEDAHPIMKEAYTLLAPKGLAVHMIDYTKTPEEDYKMMIRTSLGGEAQKYLGHFNRLSPEQKDMVLRRNIFNISPGSLEKIGYSVIAFPRMDFDNNISITLTKGAP